MMRRSSRWSGLPRPLAASNRMVEGLDGAPGAGASYDVRMYVNSGYVDVTPGLDW